MDHCHEILMNSPYPEDFLEKVLSTVSIDLEPPYDETAILVVSLGSVGYVENIELKSLSSSTIEAAFQLFIEAPPSLPRAPSDVQRARYGRWSFRASPMLSLAQNSKGRFTTLEPFRPLPTSHGALRGSP